MFFLTLIAAFDPINGDLFNYLYYNYSKNLYMVIIAMTQNKEDAEDIIQDTYQKVYLNIKKFYDLDDESTIKLLMIYSKNTANDFFRKKKRRPQTYSQEYEADYQEKTKETPDNSNSPEDILLNKESAEKLSSFIDKLAEGQRHTILLKYKYGMNNKEISKVLCITETAVSSRLDRARTTLRKMMEGEYYE